MSREPATEKSFTYFALLEAFDKEGCPVCRFMAEYSLRYIDTLVYEQVNDVDVRRKLRASRGFCNWHAWQARDIASSALGVAIIAKDLLSEEMARLDDLLGGVVTTGLHHPLQQGIAPKSIRAFIRGWRQREVCPACQVILRHERHALETILNFLRDGDFVHRFERSTQLCILHVARVVETQGRHPGLCRLIALQRHKYADLVSELDEFCRKHDYRFAREAWGAEADAGLRATELLAGKPEVFGNDVHRRQLRDGSSRGWGAVRDWWRGLMLSVNRIHRQAP